MIEIGALSVALVAFVIALIALVKANELDKSELVEMNERYLMSYRTDNDRAIKSLKSQIDDLAVRCDGLCSAVEAIDAKPSNNKAGRNKSKSSGPKRDENGRFKSAKQDATADG